MQITKFVCDRCGHSHTNLDPQEKRKPLHVVAIHVAGAGPNEKSLSAEWCRACCVKAGIVVPKKDDPPAPKEPPKLDDLIRQIVDARIEAATGARP